MRMGKPSPLGSCFLGRVLRRRAAGEVGIPAATTRARPRAPGSRSIAAMRNCRHNRAPWPRPRPRRSWRATLSFACVRVAGAALLLLPAAAAYAPGGAAEPHGRRHGRDADASNQTAPAAAAAPPLSAEKGQTLRGRARAWLADPTAVAAQGPIAAWDTREETNLSAIFVDAAEFNEGLNTCVLTFAVWRARLLSLGVGSI